MGKDQPFSKTALLSLFERFPAYERLLIAFSGGCDSSVLLHALAALRQQQSISDNIMAIYVDHGLNEASAAWGHHCRSFSSAINIPFISKKVDATKKRGQSPEATARNARYAAFYEEVRVGDALITAHHADDQAETLMLQMLRGAGPKGLAAMPECTPFGKGDLLRPLLSFTRSELEQYATQHALQWLDDPSNTEDRYDRNYLRQTVMPLLLSRWPALCASLGRVAAHQAEACRLMAGLARDDFSVAKTGDCLSLKVLLTLDEDRQRNLLRYWIQSKTLCLPSAAIMAQILHAVIAAKGDRSPLLVWGGFELRRYREKLYLDKVLRPHNAAVTLLWDGEDALELPSNLGILRVRQSDGAGLNLPSLNKARISVRFRQGGERIKPHGQVITHDLKKLFQNKAVPPWLRNRIPLIFAEDELVAVVGYWLADAFTIEHGLELFVDPALRVA